MTTKPSGMLTLTDQLSRLSFLQACRLLGENGNRLIQAGARYEIDIDAQVSWNGEVFRLWLPDTGTNGDGAAVTITRANEGRQRLRWSCSACETACEHAGAAFSLILEEKTTLRLAAPPRDRVSVESLSEEALVRKALDERAERARDEKMKVRSADPEHPWTDYTVTYFKPERSPQLLAKDISARDDSRLPMTGAEFLAKAWRLANDKARALGWIV